MKMRAIAIDDEPIALDVIRSHGNKVPFLDLTAEFTDAMKALDFLQNEKVDLIFLDIKMPDISGIEFYNSLNHKPLLVFTTAYDQHAVTSFEMDAVDYLLKPFSLARFLKACNKAYELFGYRQEQKQEEYIYIKSGYEQHRIQFDKILYLESSGNYVSIITESKKILTRSTLQSLFALLPQNKFIRVHRSYIVPLEKISKAERHRLTIGEHHIPVSESYRKDLDQALRNI